MTARLTRALACQLVWLAFLPSACWGSVYSDSVIADTGPVLYWNQDETGGTTAFDLVPSVGGANNGTYVAHTGHSVILGGAGPRPSDGFADMDAANAAPTVDYYGTTVYDSLNTTAGASTSAYSLQVWFNSTALYTAKPVTYVFTRANGTTESDRRDAVYVGGTYTGIQPRKLAFVPGNNASAIPPIFGTRDLQENTWYHLVFVRDDSQPVKAKVYLNGRLQIQSTQSWWGGGTGNYLYAANRPDYNIALGISGRYDEVAAWDRALSTDEVWGLFTAALDGPPYARAVMSDVPEAYWRLNETAGENLARDISGNDKHQTLGSGLSPYVTRSGTPPDVGPRQSDFLRSGPPLAGFGGTNNAPTIPIGRTGWTDNDYALVVHADAASAVVVPDDKYTVEAWVRPSNTTTYGTVGYLFHRRDFDGTSGFGDAMGMGGTYPTGAPAGALFYFNGTTSTWDSTPTILVPDQWYYVALVRDGSNISVYLDGELELATTSAVGGPFDQGTWVFGGRSDHQGLKWPGNIDEIAIYGRALSAEEIYAHFYAAQVPEPSTWFLLALGGLGLAAWGRRRRAG